MNYLIIGDDEYLREREEAKIKEKFLSAAEEELNYSVHRPDSVGSIMDSLTTVPFLADKRVVLVKEAHDLPREAIESMISYLEKPTQNNVLVLSASSELKKNKTYGKLSKLVKTVRTDAPDIFTVKKWVKTFFKKEGIDASGEAVGLISELKGQDTVGIKMEVEKLAAYSGGQRIEAGDVEKLVGRSVRDTVFKLVDAINEKNAEWAFRVISDLKDQKKQAPEIVGYMGWYLKVIQKILLLSAKKAGLDAIASEIGYSKGYVKRLMAQSKSYNAAKVGRWLSLLLETDRDIKTGKKEADLALEMLIADFLKS